MIHALCALSENAGDIVVGAGWQSSLGDDFCPGVAASDIPARGQFWRTIYAGVANHEDLRVERVVVTLPDGRAVLAVRVARHMGNTAPFVNVPNPTAAARPTTPAPRRPSDRRPSESKQQHQARLERLARMQRLYDAFLDQLRRADALLPELTGSGTLQLRRVPLTLLTALDDLMVEAGTVQLECAQVVSRSRSNGEVHAGDIAMLERHGRVAAAYFTAIQACVTRVQSKPGLSVSGSQRPPRVRLQWEVLPPERLAAMLAAEQGASRPNESPAVEPERLRYMLSLSPKVWYEGTSLGRRYYVVALFEGVAVADAAESGNALYYHMCRGSEWQDVFCLSKREARQAGASRLIHRGDWRAGLRRIVQEAKPAS